MYPLLYLTHVCAGGVINYFIDENYEQNDLRARNGVHGIANLSSFC